MDIPDTPGCVCGRGGRVEQRQGSGDLWLNESESAMSSSLSTSLLTKNKPFPIRGVQQSSFKQILFQERVKWDKENHGYICSWTKLFCLFFLIAWFGFLEIAFPENRSQLCEVYHRCYICQNFSCYILHNSHGKKTRNVDYNKRAKFYQISTLALSVVTQKLPLSSVFNGIFCVLTRHYPQYQRGK